MKDEEAERRGPIRHILLAIAARMQGDVDAMQT